MFSQSLNGPAEEKTFLLYQILALASRSAWRAEDIPNVRGMFDINKYVR